MSMEHLLTRRPVQNKKKILKKRDDAEKIYTRQDCAIQHPVFRLDLERQSTEYPVLFSSFISKPHKFLHVQKEMALCRSDQSHFSCIQSIFLFSSNLSEITTDID